MSREAHVRFSEGLGVKFPGATHLITGSSCCWHSWASDYQKKS